MANSFGPPGAGGGDPVAKSIADAIKPAVNVVDAEAKKLAKSIKKLADDMAASAKGLNRQRSTEMLRAAKAEESAVKSLMAQRSRALIAQFNAESQAIASLSKQRSRQMLADIQGQERAKKSLEAQRSRELLRAEKEKENIQKSAQAKALRDAEKAAREKEKEQERLRKAQEKEDAARKASQQSLNSQRSREYQKELNEQEKARKKAASDAKKQQAADDKEAAARRKVQASLSAQQSREYQKQLKEEAAAKEKEKRLETKWQAMLDKEQADKKKEEEQGKKQDIANFFGFFGKLKSSFDDLIGIIGSATKFVAAFNPGLVAQLGFAMKDLYATIGMALQPVVEGATAAVRNFADFLVPIAKEFAPLISQFVAAFLDLFIQLFPKFRDLFSIIEIFVQVATFLTKAFAYIMEPLLWWLEGFSIILAKRAIVAIISFAAAAETSAALMTGGLSLLIGGIATAALGFGRFTGMLKDFEFKAGASVGMGARQASYSGITEFGKNILAQSLGAGAATAAADTANNTRRCAEALERMEQNRGGGQAQVGGDGVAARRAREQAGIGGFLNQINPGGANW